MPWKSEDFLIFLIYPAIHDYISKREQFSEMFPAMMPTSRSSSFHHGPTLKATGMKSEYLSKLCFYRAIPGIVTSFTLSDPIENRRNGKMRKVNIIFFF